MRINYLHRINLLISLCILTLTATGQNSGLDFTASDQNRMIIQDDQTINFTNNFSIEFIIQPKEIAGQMAILQEGLCNGSRASYSILIAPDSTLRITTNCNGNCSFANGYTVQTKIIPGQCLHVAITYSTDLKVYFDGVLQPGFYHVNSFCGTLKYSTDDLHVGFYEGASGNKVAFFDGIIDELRFWNKVLTSSEIVANHQVSLTGVETHLAAYYNFDSVNSGGGNIVQNMAVATGPTLNGFTFSNSTTTPRTEVSCPLSISIDETHLANLDFNLFPNPVTEILTINWENQEINSVSVEIYNIQGQLIIQLNDVKPLDQIDFSGLSSGVYTVHVQSGKSITTSRVIKQ